MNIYIQLVDFWSTFLFGISYNSGDSFESSDIYGYFENFRIFPHDNTDTIVKNGQVFWLQFLQSLPQILSFLTIALAVFLFCFMMYKIIKLFTSLQ